MMKRVFSISLLVIPLFTFGQMTAMLSNNSDGDTYLYSYSAAPLSENEAAPKFALTVNPLGFVQFGPIIGAEIGLTDNVVLNVHTRISSMGVLSYVVRDADKISGFSFGAGPIIFLTDRQSKPYVGLLIEYDRANCVYHEGYTDEYMEVENNIVFMMNGGYRFRFTNGFFISTGAYLGAVKVYWAVEPPDPSFQNNEGSHIQPYGMLEVTFGIEF